MKLITSRSDLKVGQLTWLLTFGFTSIEAQHHVFKETFPQLVAQLVLIRSKVPPTSSHNLFSQSCAFSFFYAVLFPLRLGLWATLLNTAPRCFNTAPRGVHSPWVYLWKSRLSCSSQPQRWLRPSIRDGGRRSSSVSRADLLSADTPTALPPLTRSPQ